MRYPIADKFKDGSLVKPIFKKEEFYIGGFWSILDRFKLSVKSFPGAFEEFESRTEDFDIVDTVSAMRDYVKVE